MLNGDALLGDANSLSTARGAAQQQQQQQQEEGELMKVPLDFFRRNEMAWRGSVRPAGDPAVAQAYAKANIFTS